MIQIMNNPIPMLQMAYNSRARNELFYFILKTWYKKESFIEGWHIKEICDKIDDCIEKYKQGISSYLILTMPPRHGKSHIVSRSLPVYFKSRFQETEIIVTSYAANLLTRFSKDSRDKIMQNEGYKDIYPNLTLSKKSASITEWGIAKDGQMLEGELQYSGILGGLTGKGYHLGIADDLLKGREEAESEVIRDKVWDEFIDSFLTRAAPVSITILMNTRWHIDDPVGRIKNRMDPHHEDYDENFPKFEIINYPCESAEYIEKPDNNKYLFPKRFNEDYYNARKSTMSSYSYSAIMLQDPTLRGGNLFKVDNIQIINEMDLPDGLKWVRAWDMASSEKERVSNDPDWTVGVNMAIKTEWIKDIPLRKIYIKDMVRFRHEATARNELILATTEKDGDSVKLAIESYGAYKDAYIQLRDLMLGYRIVWKVNTTGDKVVRATPQEAIIEAKNMFLVEGEWNNDFIKEYTTFPAGIHDDIVDAVSTGWHSLTKMAVIK
jgi:predicted phage terminase large subunit-like protein